MCSLAVLMTANKLPLKACLQLASFVMVLWTLGLYLFWHFLIPERDTSENNVAVPSSQTNSNPETDTQQPAVSEGWTTKVKTRDDDRRLPTTIVTGFLV